MQGALAGVRGLGTRRGAGVRVQHGGEVRQASVPEDGEAEQTLDLLPAVQALPQARRHVREGGPAGGVDQEVTLLCFYCVYTPCVGHVSQV